MSLFEVANLYSILICLGLRKRVLNDKYSSVCIFHFNHACSLKQKIACKIHDEHSTVKDMPPPTETLAKMAAKNIPSGRQGTCKIMYIHCNI